MEMAGHTSWAAAVIDHRHCLIESERIAHPSDVAFPHIRDQVFLKFFGCPLRKEAGPMQSLIRLLSAIQENYPSRNGAERVAAAK
jgi:hypothetical protein